MEGGGAYLVGSVEEKLSERALGTAWDAGGHVQGVDGGGCRAMGLSVNLPPPLQTLPISFSAPGRRCFLYFAQTPPSAA